MIINKDCLEALKTLPDNSIDSIVTDPPYGLSFMGKKWDYDVPSIEIWAECLRVLKPGGYVLAFSGTRTYHRMASAIEDAGFEVRDMIEWVYGSGFPKSRNIGLDVDKRNGVTKNRGKAFVVAGQSGQRDKDTGGDLVPGSNTMGAYIAQNEWSGWGTALKPAHEPICMARKPLAEKTVAENVLKYGVGGINIDGSRAEGEIPKRTPNYATDSKNIFNPTSYGMKGHTEVDTNQGRFPANLIHDGSEEVLELFPDTKTNSTGKNSPADYQTKSVFGAGYKSGALPYEGDSGSAARFFKNCEFNETETAQRFLYCPKASKSERNMGLDGFEEKENMRVNAPRENEEEKTANKMANFHPTVKPIKLMEYLVNLVSKEGHTILDPFAGSGTTGIACKKLNRNFIGIERDEEYCKIAEARINNLTLK